MKTTRQFDGLNKGEALREVLKEFSVELLQDFEFDNDTQIATFDVRGVPVFSRDPDPESDESKMLNLATIATRESKKELDEKILALDSRERELQEKGFQLNALEKIIDEKQTRLNQSIKELEKIKSGNWKRIKSFFHRQT